MVKQVPPRVKSKDFFRAKAYLALFRDINSNVVKLDKLKRSDDKSGFVFAGQVEKSGKLKYPAKMFGNGIVRVFKLQPLHNAGNSLKTTSCDCSACYSNHAVDDCICLNGNCKVFVPCSGEPSAVLKAMEGNGVVNLPVTAGDNIFIKITP